MPTPADTDIPSFFPSFVPSPQSRRSTLFSSVVKVSFTNDLFISHSRTSTDPANTYCTSASYRLSGSAPGAPRQVRGFAQLCCTTAPSSSLDITDSEISNNSSPVALRVVGKLFLAAASNISEPRQDVVLREKVTRILPRSP